MKGFEGTGRKKIVIEKEKPTPKEQAIEEEADSRVEFVSSAADENHKFYSRLRLVCGIVSVASIAVILSSLPVTSLRALAEKTLVDLGPWAPLAFVLIYIAATVAMLPASVLTLAGAALFGFWTAYLAVTFGSVIGAACAFLIARYGARSRVEKTAAKYPKFRAIDDAITEGGWRIVALLRLSPAVPFNLQNYLYGLTNIRFWPYVLTSWLAMIPGTLMYVYLGHAAGQAVSDRSRTPGEWILLGLGLVATIVVSVYITKLARRKLAEQSSLSEIEEPVVSEKESVRFPFKAVVIACVLVGLAVAAKTNQDALTKYIQQHVESR